jgi:hypothetical protein
MDPENPDDIRHTCRTGDTLYEKACCDACRVEIKEIRHLISLLSRLEKSTRATPKDLIFAPSFIKWKELTESLEPLQPFKYEYRKAWGLWKRIGHYRYISSLMEHLDHDLEEQGDRSSKLNNECRFIMEQEEFIKLEQYCDPLELFTVHTKACALMRLIKAEIELDKAEMQFRRVAVRKDYLPLPRIGRRGSNPMTQSLRPLRKEKRRNSILYSSSSKIDLTKSLPLPGIN